MDGDFKWRWRERIRGITEMNDKTLLLINGFRITNRRYDCFRYFCNNGSLKVAYRKFKFLGRRTIREIYK